VQRDYLLKLRLISSFGLMCCHWMMGDVVGSRFVLKVGSIAG